MDHNPTWSILRYCLIGFFALLVLLTLPGVGGAIFLALLLGVYYFAQGLKRMFVPIGNKRHAAHGVREEDLPAYSRRYGLMLLVLGTVLSLTILAFLLDAVSDLAVLLTSLVLNSIRLVLPFCIKREFRQPKQNRKILISEMAFGAVILAWTTFLFLHSGPIPLSRIILDDADIRVVVAQEFEFLFAADSEEALQIREILAEHSFHRSSRTYFDNMPIHNSPGLAYFFFLEFVHPTANRADNTYLVSGGTGEIIVNSRLYRMSREAEHAMRAEIWRILDAQNSAEYHYPVA